jgi:RNA polymerase sigma-70 factor (ECF subfamily)
MELVTACLDGEEQAWKRFVRRYSRFILFIVHRKLKSANFPYKREDAEDILEDVLLTLVERDFQCLRSFQGRSKLTTWLAVLASRRAMRFIEKRRVPGISLDRIMEEGGAPIEAAVENGGLVAREEAEIKEGIWETLNGLPERDRKLLILFYRDDMKYREIGEALGIPAGNVGQFLFRAKKKLRLALERKKIFDDLS